MKNKMKKDYPRICFYDIETSLLDFRAFSCGKQFLGHKSLKNNMWNQYHIFSISYRFSDKKITRCLRWDPSKPEEELIKSFDKIITDARDQGYVCILIGKNSDRFDVKHINTQRWIHKLPPLDWITNCDDVEKQIRKHFYLPSYSLDYVAKQLGTGGKDTMNFGHWTDLSEGVEAIKLTQMIGKEAVGDIAEFLWGKKLSTVMKDYRKAFDDMDKYNRKDVDDTIAIWESIFPYVTPKYNMNTHNKMTGFSDSEIVCTSCGSEDIIKRGKSIAGMTVYQNFSCHSCSNRFKVRLTLVEKIEKDK